MSGWLFLGLEQEGSWLKRALEERPAVLWLDRIPSSQDFESTELVAEAFSEGDLKEEALQAIAQCIDWKGPVASLIEKGSAAHYGAKSGIGTRLVGFHPCPSSDDFRIVELLKGEMTQAGGILPRVLAAMINEAAYMALARCAESVL